MTETLEPRWSIQCWKDGEWWIGTCLDFERRFYAQERTEAECMETLQAMIAETIEYNRKHNLPVPNPGDAWKVQCFPYSVTYTLVSVPMSDPK